ncbi:MAG: ABC transporter ATP-binding protein [Nitrospirae bacterium]|nr:ABC transporter ATP-binding protein [Nitrospirota bacterium]MCL5238323.1 ABC transporter ATP-binding protein [Nitrospirota bacterium]
MRNNGHNAARDENFQAGHPSGEMNIASVSKAYGVGPLRQPVLEDCSFTIESGKLTVLIGPSGCGKTTLIDILAGYEKADSGIVTIDGQPVKGPGRDRLVVFQETALFPWMTTFENVIYGPMVRKEMSRKDLESRAISLLEKVGLVDFKDKYPTQLSGGMQRRAELIRAMINNPKVMIMDEPFRGLDAMTRELMQEYYVRLFEENRATNLFVTSEIEEAIFLADQLLVMSYRPAKIREVIEIELPRPREFHMLTSKEYLNYKKEALEILHEEAMKAFASGSNVAAVDFLEAYSERQAASGQEGRDSFD